MSSVRWSLEEDLAFYASAEICTIGVTVYKFVDDIAGGVEKIAATGLRSSSVLAATVRVPMIASDTNPSNALEALRPSIDVAAALGHSPCYFQAGPTPPRMASDDAYALLVPAIVPAVAYARGQGVRLAIETSSTSTRDIGFVHTLADAVELSFDADVDVCVELQNCWFDCHLRRMFHEHVDRFALVQVNDFKVGEPARLNRCVPGDGDMPVEWLLGELLEAGYAGLFELEVVGPRIEEEGYPSAITRGLAWISERLDRWGV
jgi:sugar phosphate isomerase/epimerase